MLCQHSRTGGKPGGVKVFDRHPPRWWNFSALEVSKCCGKAACVESTPDCAAAFTGRSRCFREAEIRYGVHSRHAIALLCQPCTILLRKLLQTVAIPEQNPQVETEKHLSSRVFAGAFVGRVGIEPTTQGL